MSFRNHIVFLIFWTWMNIWSSKHPKYPMIFDTADAAIAYQYKNVISRLSGNLYYSIFWSVLCDIQVCVLPMEINQASWDQSVWHHIWSLYNDHSLWHHNWVMTLQGMPIKRYNNLWVFGISSQHQGGIITCESVSPDHNIRVV